MWIPCPRAWDPDDIDPAPMETVMSRLATMARFAEPTARDPDYSGITIMVKVEDVEFAHGLAMVRQAEVTAEGDSTGGYRLISVAVLKWSGFEQNRHDWTRVTSGQIFEAVIKAAEPLIMERLDASWRNAA